MIQKQHAVSIQETELPGDDPDPLGNGSQKSYAFSFPSLFSFESFSSIKNSRLSVNAQTREFMKRH